MEDTKWVKWEPKVGEVPPEGCQYGQPKREPVTWGLWKDVAQNRPLNGFDVDYFVFRIPAPTVQEVRPPWIDPRCKFRWGDRVKNNSGEVRYVIHPADTNNEPFTVIVASSVHDAPPYSTKADLIEADLWYSSGGTDGYREHHLTLCPEYLPKHYDDTQQPVKKFECWLVVSIASGVVLVASGDQTHAMNYHLNVYGADITTIHHMREVLE
jgi:hypothetical protein